VRVVVLVALSFPGLAVVAFAASRLLGVRRSWLAIAVSSLVGWILGFAVALAVGAGRLDEAPLYRNTLLLAFIFTMAVEVGLDLLAKPGTLRRPDEAGVLRLPHPRTYVRERLEVIRRTRQIVEIAMRNGIGPQLGLRRGSVLPEGWSEPNPVQVRRVLEQCGGMFVKVGQLVSTRTDLISPEMAAELALLQRQVAPEDPAAMRALIEEELGAPVDQVFAAFDWDPIGTASIAQVYKATLVTGEAVVVKAQRPGVADVVARDSKVLLRLADAAERNTAWGVEYNVGQLARELVQGVAAELDFRAEATNAVGIGANMVGVAGVRVPLVYARHSTSRLLVQERFEGPSVGEALAVDALGAHREALADHLLRAALKQMMVDGWFHADLHPGNVLVLSPDEVGIIDFGACGRLDPLQQASLRQMLIATALREPAMLRRAVADVCEIPGSVDDEALERALARFLAVNVTPGEGVGANAVADLLEMLTRFGIHVPMEFTTFGRALVQLEGTLRTLSPGYSFTDAAQGMAEEWVAAKRSTSLHDLDQAARKELLSLLPTVKALPVRADRVLRRLEHGELGIKASLFSSEVDTRFVSKIVNRVVLAFLGALLGVISALLLSTSGGPAFAGEVTLLQFLGYLGLFSAAVLMLRVVAAVVREGLN
jgi:ubiquinone biosynthesis protein